MAVVLSIGDDAVALALVRPPGCGNSHAARRTATR